MNERSPNNGQTGSAGPSWPDFAALLLSALLLVVIRSHGFALPLETDECNYVYIAGRMVAGDYLYRDVWDHQPPGIFVLFGSLIVLFGDGEMVFRWAAVGASLISLLLIYVITLRVAGRWAGLFAALLFALCSADPGTAGEGCNREIFMNVFSLGAVWMLLRSEGQGRGRILWAGLLLGVGSTIKTVLAGQWILLAIWLAVAAWRRPGMASDRDAEQGANGKTQGVDQVPSPPAAMREKPRWMAAMMAVLAFGFGPLLVWLAVAGHYLAGGRFREFVEAAFLFNLQYSDVTTSYLTRFIEFFQPPVHRHVFDGVGPLYVAAIAGCVLVYFASKPQRRGQWLVVCYLVGSYLAVCLPGQLWPHYYYLMVPPLVIACAMAFGNLLGLRRSETARAIGTWSSAGLAVTLLLSVGVLQAASYLLRTPSEITDLRYDSRDFWGRAQGWKVGQVTDPGDTILVYARDVGVYYYSGRRSATRFTMVNPLHESFAGFEERRQILLDEVRKNRPRLAMMVDPPFPELFEYLAENYDWVGTDYHDRRQNQPVMQVWADRKRPVRPIDWNWHREEVRMAELGG